MSEDDEPQPDKPQPHKPTETGSGSPPAGEEPPAPATPAYGSPTPAYGGVPPTAAGPVGQVRETGTCILLTVVTLGFYSLYWYYKTHDEMKQHTGTGLGGPVALLLAIFVGFVMPFFNSHEVGRLYERRGEEPPVTAMTGLWALLLGWFFFVGSIVWFVKTNRALNDYWLSLGAE